MLYYSTNTYLSHFITKRFYNSKHFVWCSPVFDPTKLDEYDPYKRIPPSSSPCKIYNVFFEDVHGSDLHSSKIEGNKIGLKKGAGIHLGKGTISENEYARILTMIDSASINDFRPLLYLIPKDIVKHKVIEVPVEECANPLSVEYQIENLSSDEFEFIELKDL